MLSYRFGRGVLLASFLALMACEQPPVSEQARIDKAEAFVAQGAWRSGLLEMRNAVRDYPESARARQLLGEILLAMGDPASAVSAFARARSLGSDDPELIEQELVALRKAGAFDDALARLADADLAHEDAHAANILFAAGRFSDAFVASEAALASQPDAPDVLLTAGWLHLMAGELDVAKAHAAAADGAAAGQRALLGEIALSESRFDEAEALYGELLAQRGPLQALPLTLDMRDLPPEIGLARAHLGAGAVDEAAAAMARLPEHAAHYPPAMYYTAVIALQQRDYAKAARVAGELNDWAPDHVPSLALSGAAKLALGHFEQAERDLRRLLRLSPGHDMGVRLLASLQMQTGESARALSILERNLRPDDDLDANVLALVGEAALRAGAADKGRAYLTSAVAQAPDRADLRLRLGAAELAAGDADSGFRTLESVIAQGEGGGRAEAVLILAHLQQGQTAQALRVAQDWAAREPESADAQSMLGVVSMANDDPTGGAAAFEAALAIDPGHVQAAANLAALKLEDSPGAALAVLDDALTHNPDSPVLLMRSARLLASQGDLDGAIARAEQAIDVSGDGVDAPLLLAQYQLVAGRVDESLSAATLATERAPDDSRAWMALGVAQLRDGQPSNAVRSFDRVLAREQVSAQAHYFRAKSYQASQQIERARDDLAAALAADADFLPAYIALARFDLAAGDVTAAQANMTALRTRQAKPELAERRFASLAPDSLAQANLDDLEGRIALAAGEPARALARFEAAQAGAPSTGTLLALVEAQSRAGDAEGALRRLADWVETHSGDQAARFILSTRLIQLERHDEALTHLQLLAQGMPTSVPVRNNLAWVLMKTGDLERAKTEIAEVVRLAPNDPRVLDTQGRILLALDDPVGAAPLLQRAAEALDDNAQPRVKLAEAYQRLGDDAQARAVLEALLQDGGAARLEDPAAVQALLGDLNG
ncbi:MAG: XrtA/PEP-CTERM system TPR-repeat protein PrsT [Geminicoccaceae bacterium]